MIANPLSEFGKHQKIRFWIAPVVGIAAAAVLAAGAVFLDTQVSWGESPLPVFVGHPDTARTLLSVIATSVATLIALVFTILAVVIQLATGEYSPRSLSVLLQDRPSQFTNGVFVGTFTYALIILLSLPHTTENERESVSGIAMTLAFILAVVSLTTFAVYSNHIIQSVRVSSIVRRIAEKTRSAIERVYPSADQPNAESFPDRAAGAVGRTLQASRAGVFSGVDDKQLLKATSRQECTITILPPLGAFVPEGFPLAEIDGGAKLGGDELARIEQAIELGRERNPALDIGFGVRQLTDIAARALSAGVNDPATAVAAIDQLHDLFRRLVRLDLSGGNCVFTGGGTRLFFRIASWDEFEHCIGELRLFGKSSPHVMRRVRAMLEDLVQVAPPARADAVRRQIALLVGAIDQALDDSALQDMAKEPDLRGIGY